LFSPRSATAQVPGGAELVPAGLKTPHTVGKRPGFPRATGNKALAPGSGSAPAPVEIVSTLVARAPARPPRGNPFGHGLLGSWRDRPATSMFRAQTAKRPTARQAFRSPGTGPGPDAEARVIRLLRFAFTVRGRVGQPRPPSIGPPWFSGSLPYRRKPTYAPGAACDCPAAGHCLLAGPDRKTSARDPTPHRNKRFGLGPGPQGADPLQKEQSRCLPPDQTTCPTQPPGWPTDGIGGTVAG